MTVDVSFAIQTHPARADMAAELVLDIGGPVDLAVDPDPTNRRGAWRTYRHALETTPASATHRVVVQDDTIVCPHFRHAAAAAIAARPDDLVVFFVAGVPRPHAMAVMTACAQDKTFAPLYYATWCPAVACGWPVALAADLLAFVDRQRWPATFLADDEIIGRFCRATKRFPLATVPSLVEHPDLVPSLIGRRTRYGQDPGRVATCFISDEYDAREIEWV